MAKIQFNIKYRPQIESGEYKVETRDGRPVRIICWDLLRDKFPILALSKNVNSEDILAFTERGKYYSVDSESCLDLFIITTDDELTEFEKEICGVSNLELNYNMKEEVRAAAAHILALAREEIETTLPKWKKCEKKGYGSLRYRVYSKISGEEFIYDQVGGMEIPISELEKLPSEED